jgi:hypothetical protein
MAGKLLVDYIQTESGTLYVQNATGGTVFSANTNGFYAGTGQLVIGTGGTANSNVNIVTANAIAFSDGTRQTTAGASTGKAIAMSMIFGG